MAASGIRTSRLNQIIATPRPRAEPRVRVEWTPGRPRPIGRVSSPRTADDMCQLPTWRPAIILVMIPVFSSKNLVLALVPATEGLVDRVLGLHRRERVARVVGTRHVDVDPRDDRAEAGLGVVGLAGLAELELQEVLAPGSTRPWSARRGSGSAACRREGCSRRRRRRRGRRSSRSRRRAARRRCPPTNDASASLPLPGRATTLWSTLLTKACAWASVPPWPLTWAQAARMFHLAEPEEAGLGVMILTPGLTRSSQVLMPSGLPLRTRNTTSESVQDALGGGLVPATSRRGRRRRASRRRAPGRGAPRRRAGRR